MRIKTIALMIILLSASSVFAGLDAANGKIVNVADCCDPNDAANKRYVDANVDQAVKTTSRPTFAAVNLTSQVLIKGGSGDLQVRNLTDTGFADIVADQWIIGSGAVVASVTGITCAAGYPYTIQSGTIGQALNLYGGTSSGVMAGGIATLQGGSSSSSGAGGNALVTGGSHIAAGGGPYSGGNVILTGGSTLTGVSGSINLVIPAGVTGNGQIYCNGETRIRSLSGLLLGTSGVVSVATPNDVNAALVSSGGVTGDANSLDVLHFKAGLYIGKN